MGYMRPCNYYTHSRHHPLIVLRGALTLISSLNLAFEMDLVTEWLPTNNKGNLSKIG